MFAIKKPRIGAFLFGLWQGIDSLTGAYSLVER
jgi:hypothetical protein